MTHRGGTPTLSVIIDNYNYAAYLREAMESVLSQLVPGDELIVVDDGSSDGSREVLARYADQPGVTLLLQENQGQVAAIFNGLAQARGELCLLLDSDDYYLPGYLQRIRQVAAAQPRAALLFSAYTAGGDNTAGVARMQDMQHAMCLPEGLTGLSRWGTVVAGEYLGSPTSGLALRASLVAQLLQAREKIPDRMPVPAKLAGWMGFPQGSFTALRLAADGIIVRAASVAGCNKYYLPEPGFFYRIHGVNAFASLRWWGRLYLRLQRSRHIAKLCAVALAVPRRPLLTEVLEEAAQRSRPLQWRRRLRLRLNYALGVLLSRGVCWHKPGALLRVASIW